MNSAKRLAQAVGAWLQFEFACNRAELFNERCLGPAIAGGLHAIYKEEVRSEYLHPILGPLKTGPGRRPEVDFAVVRDYPKVICVLESKWIGASGVRIDDILWDLFRLELIAHDSGATSFFLLAGKRKYRESFFSSTAFKGKRTKAGKYRASILKMYPQPRLRVSDAPERKIVFRKLFEPYQDLSFPSELSTTVGTAYPATCPMSQYQAYVWQVFSPAGIRRFLPKDHHAYTFKT